MKHFLCKGCGNLIAMVNDSGKRVSCCNEKMDELTPNSREASAEKHKPRLKVAPGKVTVTIGEGENIHPMDKDHSVRWVCLVTNKGSQRKLLMPGEEPKVTFYTDKDEDVIKAFAYCNLHGLWVSDVKGD